MTLWNTKRELLQNANAAIFHSTKVNRELKEPRQEPIVFGITDIKSRTKCPDTPFLKVSKLLMRSESYEGQGCFQKMKIT